jgi:SAM-dependent methyltransferase
MALLLNLGCGDRTDPAWVNIDQSARGRLRAIPGIRRLVGGPNPPGYVNWDLRRGIPCADGAAAVAYASHMLEHLQQPEADAFLREAYRVLQPGGIARIVVPDLEQLARDYLAALERWRDCGAGAGPNEEAYDWSVILLLDQMVRRQPGGAMAPWLRARRDLPFVRGMHGIFREIAEGAEHGSVFRKLWRPDPARTGELHQWMYDEESLRRALHRAGFREARRTGHLESNIPAWTSYHLDADPDGTPHHPGSVWMEALR